MEGRRDRERGSKREIYIYEGGDNYVESFRACLL